MMTLRSSPFSHQGLGEPTEHHTASKNAEGAQAEGGLLFALLEAARLASGDDSKQDKDLDEQIPSPGAVLHHLPPHLAHHLHDTVRAGSPLATPTHSKPTSAAGSPRKSSKRAKRSKGHRCPAKLIPGGPCVCCGVRLSPQWRRPLEDDSMLCNACGIFYTRHKTLPERKQAPDAAAMLLIQEEMGDDMTDGTTGTDDCQTEPSAPPPDEGPGRMEEDPAPPPCIKGDSCTSTDERNAAAGPGPAAAAAAAAADGPSAAAPALLLPPASHSCDSSLMVLPMAGLGSPATANHPNSTPRAHALPTRITGAALPAAIAAAPPGPGVEGAAAHVPRAPHHQHQQQHAHPCSPTPSESSSSFTPDSRRKRPAPVDCPFTPTKQQRTTTAADAAGAAATPGDADADIEMEMAAACGMTALANAAAFQQLEPALSSPRPASSPVPTHGAAAAAAAAAAALAAAKDAAGSMPLAARHSTAETTLNAHHMHSFAAAAAAAAEQLQQQQHRDSSNREAVSSPSQPLPQVPVPAPPAATAQALNRGNANAAAAAAAWAAAAAGSPLSDMQYAQRGPMLAMLPPGHPGNAAMARPMMHGEMHPHAGARMVHPGCMMVAPQGAMMAGPHHPHHRVMSPGPYPMGVMPMRMVMTPNGPMALMPPGAHMMAPGMPMAALWAASMAQYVPCPSPKRMQQQHGYHVPAPARGEARADGSSSGQQQSEPQ